MARTSFQSALTRARKKKPARFAPSLPPLGSYDPSILMQYGANQRGANDYEDQFALAQAQAQDDFAIQTGRLGENQQQTLADLTTRRTRNLEDYNTSKGDIQRRYGEQAAVQSERAIRSGVQSQGLLAQALARRMENAKRDQTGLDTSLARSQADLATAEQRSTSDFDQRKADLALNLARMFGSGKGGQPLGSNTLQLIQTRNNATAGNLDLSAVAYQQAAANGFRFPRRRRKAAII